MKCYCSSIQIFFCIILLFGVVSFTNLAWRVNHYDPKTIHWTYDEFLQKKTVDSEFAPQTDKEWLGVLRSGKIVSIKPFPAGLARKFISVLEGGYKAMIKPYEGIHYLKRNIKPLNFFELSKREQDKVARAQWEYQGWSEVAGYYIDRALKLYKKPPITGRFVSNKELYNFDGTLWGFFWRSLPVHWIPVSVHAWTEKMTTSSPDKELQQFLSMNLLIPRKLSSRLIQISDKLVLDFLLDDHDAVAAHNWKERFGKLIHWDSGLAWRHGPYSDLATCKTILCGNLAWKSSAGAWKTCDKLCVFSKYMYNVLLSVAADETSLGDKMKSLMLDDPTFPIFNYGVYHRTANQRMWGDWDKVSFPLEDFQRGLDMRVKTVLEHIEECKNKFGEDRVLLK